MSNVPAACLLVLTVATASCAAAAPAPPRGARTDPAATSAARGAPPAEASGVTGSFETVKVADGVFAFMAPEPKTELVSGNSVAVIGEDAVLVVDSGHFPALTPGHGPVQHDFEYVKLVVEALDAVTRQVRAAVQEGLSLDEKPAVERAYEEAKGKLSDE